MTVKADIKVENEQIHIKGEPTEVLPDERISYTMEYLRYYIAKLELMNKRRLQSWFALFG